MATRFAPRIWREELEPNRGIRPGHRRTKLVPSDPLPFWTVRRPQAEGVLRLRPLITHIVPVQAAIFLGFGLYRGLWRFASILDLQRIVLSAGLGAIVIPLVIVMLQLQATVPRSVLILYPLVLIFLMAGNRFAYRIWKAGHTAQVIDNAAQTCRV